MKIPTLKEFSNTVSNQTLKDIALYLSTELVQNLREIVTALKKLTFSDNFESFQTTVTIEAASELAIRNQMRGTIPSKRLIVRGDDQSPNVVDGDTDWDLNYVYLKNIHATLATTVTVIFFK